MEEEITITMSRADWLDLLVDLDAWVDEMSEISDYSGRLEPGTENLRRMLRSKGLSL